MFTNEEYVDMLLVYGRCNENAAASAREYAVRFPHRRLPNHNVFLRLIARARETGNLVPERKGVGGVDRTVRTPHREEQILHEFEESAITSIRIVASHLQISRSTIQRVLHDNRKHPYHYQRVQSLLAEDYQKRVQFCTWLLEQHEANPNFIGGILFTDESTFGRQGIFNSHNFQFSHMDRRKLPRNYDTQSPTPFP